MITGQLGALYNLELEHFPHCSVAHPNLYSNSEVVITKDHEGKFERGWRMYQCATCGGVVVAYDLVVSTTPIAKFAGIVDYFPKVKKLSENIPHPAYEYLRQASSSLHAPAGAVMLAASPIDAMFKDKGLTSGTLYKRIDEAVSSGLITKEMGEWAHNIRMDANEQRHADIKSQIPSRKDAEILVEFAIVLADILYEYPARVQKGLKLASE